MTCLRVAATQVIVTVFAMAVFSEAPGFSVAACPFMPSAANREIPVSASWFVSSAAAAGILMCMAPKLRGAARSRKRKKSGHGDVPEVLQAHPARTRLRAGYTAGPCHTLECKQISRTGTQFAGFGCCSYHGTDTCVRKEARGNVKEADLTRWTLTTDS